MKILNRFTGEVIFECNSKSMNVAVKLALESGANLSWANLYWANLYWANLYGANLYGANLYGANLSGANLSGANLSWANLSWANLYGANLSGANLSWANLYGANLYGANLSGANLYGANLYGAKISKCPIQIGAGMKWWICITEFHIQIGCQIHEAETWFKFSDEEISQMHGEALPWWKENKDIIKALWVNHCK